MNEMFVRNRGYVSLATQEKISNIRVLIAGCGIGGQLAIAAARIGIKHFTLIDGDRIELHNLNRQVFFHREVGEYKVNALANQLQEINPNCQVNIYPQYLTADNVDKLVVNSDFIFDTIDFLDLTAIVMLHDSALRHRRPLISLFSAGWGACLVHQSVTDPGPSLMRKVFNLGTGVLQQTSYAQAFRHFVTRLIPHLAPAVQVDMQLVLTKMEDQKPCPASHVIVGAQMVASLGITAMVKILDDQKVISGAEILIVDLEKILTWPGVSLL